MVFETRRLIKLENIRISLTYPSTVVGFLRHGKIGAYRRLLECILTKLSATETQILESCLEESSRTGSLVMPPGLTNFNGSASLQNKVLLHYLVRIYKPTFVLETGVWDGQTSWFILRGLEDNGNGNLTSVDLGLKEWKDPILPGGSVTLPTKDIGDFVPNSLRPRWHLVLGDTKDVLPTLMPALGKIDLYYHDSDYSYSGMKRELTTVLPYLRKSGILGSDLVYVNSCFSEFLPNLTGVSVVGQRFVYGFKSV